MPVKISRDLFSSICFRSCVLLTLAITAMIFAFSKPSAEHRLPNPSQIASYQIEEKPNYLEKIIDPINILTLALVISTVFLWRSTDRLARLAEDQGRITNDLFLKDQRPWINVSLTTRDAQPDFNVDGSITLMLRVNVKNIGKSPAFDVGNGWVVHIGYDGFEEQFQSMRSFTEAQSFSKGVTIFPGDDASWNTTETITKEQIEESIAIPDQGMGSAMQFIIVSYQYKSGFCDDALETVRMYKFGIGSFEGSLPANRQAANGKKVELKLWKELIT